ncbi:MULTISPECIES: hypothetical protein [Flavobacterium]|uniref:Uncharacterized protein n=1 Tax=Flavobacterium jumunjinense TaxID=998845 RepID=A0ABV5GPC6_9FLAO|nr:MULTISPECIES: hypothetical protein [Flavobacterium]
MNILWFCVNTTGIQEKEVISNEYIEREWDQLRSKLLIFRKRKFKPERNN